MPTHAILTVLRMTPTQATRTSSDFSNSYEFASHSYWRVIGMPFTPREGWDNPMCV